jgi:hypothetical protein
MEKAPLWGYTIISITALLMDTYIPVTLLPLAQDSSHLPCASPVQYINFTSNSLCLDYPHVKSNKYLRNQYQSTRSYP